MISSVKEFYYAEFGIEDKQEKTIFVGRNVSGRRKSVPNVQHLCKLSKKRDDPHHDAQ